MSSEGIAERAAKMREEMLAEQINGWPNTVSDILAEFAAQEAEIAALRIALERILSLCEAGGDPFEEPNRVVVQQCYAALAKNVEG